MVGDFDIVRVITIKHLVYWYFIIVILSQHIVYYSSLWQSPERVATSGYPRQAAQLYRILRYHSKLTQVPFRYVIYSYTIIVKHTSRFLVQYSEATSFKALHETKLLFCSIIAVENNILFQNIVTIRGVVHESKTVVSSLIGSRRSPSPYATTHIGEHVYAKPESRVSYYAASNLTHVSQVSSLSHIITTLTFCFTTSKRKCDLNLTLIF